MKRLPRHLVLILVVSVLIAAVLVLPSGCGTTTVDPTSSVHQVELEKVINARDLGGWILGNGTKIPYGRVFRSGMLANATEDDLEALRKLGIQTSIDLRTTAEVNKFGKDPVGPQGLSRTINAPITGKASEAGYRDSIKNQKASTAIAFHALADGSTYPVIIHCMVGKDRTGIVSALLLELLGVPRQQIVEDYLLSSSVGEVNEDWIDAALKEVDAAGGINKYLSGIGIDASMQNAIKKHVLGH